MLISIDDKRSVLTLELISPFAADAQDQDSLAIGLERLDALSRQTDNVGVKASAKTPIGRSHN
jgi:hypothetical protein